MAWAALSRARVEGQPAAWRKHFSTSRYVKLLTLLQALEASPCGGAQLVSCGLAALSRARAVGQPAAWREHISISGYLKASTLLQALEASPGGGPHLVFLGTGCAEPSKYRGASALHLRAAPGAGLLLDAGEGAWGQLVRFYGRRRALRQVGACCET